MKKLIYLLFCIIFSCLFILTGCRPTTSSPTTTYKIGVLRVHDSLPLYVAEHENLFKEMGVPIQIVEFNSALDQRKAMESGALDGMMTDMIVTSLLKKGGTDVRIIATALGATPKEGRFLIVSSPNSTIQTPTDLYKGNVAIAHNTMMEYLLNQYEEELHLDSTKIKTIQLPNLSLRVDAVLAGKDVKAAILPDPLASYAVQKGAHIVIDDTKLKGNYSQSVIIMKKNILTQHANEISRFLSAYHLAITHINENPTAYRTLALQKAGIPKDISNTYNPPSFTPHALPSPQEVQQVMRWMVAKKLLPTPYTYEEMVKVS